MPAASTASRRLPNTARPAITTPAATSAVDPSALSVRNTATAPVTRVRAPTATPAIRAGRVSTGVEAGGDDSDMPSA